ncbi:hypothetical protein [Luteimonas fraxinea]|uniref:hypothetical protein n=1 Tax=Luteimonas fraxinea TaxID=2901869 RepID=UPI001E5767E9|nr:hypothetical protein [Luteimonas fraxinea]MCD9126007.1 hypothetical protein [Luteimonas fraxinea]
MNIDGFDFDASGRLLITDSDLAALEKTFQPGDMMLAAAGPTNEYCDGSGGRNSGCTNENVCSGTTNYRCYNRGTCVVSPEMPHI